MDATNPMSADIQRQQDRKRKRKAVLAGGVVLGLGAAITLAAWSDDVFADGLFNTGGVFLLEGSAETFTATNFTAAQTEDAAVHLEFTAGGSSTAVTPGDTVYAPFSVRLTSASTLDGTLDSVTPTATGPMAGALQYTITSGATACANGTADGTTWASGPVNAGTAVDGVSELALTANAANTPGDTVQLCVAVTFPDTPEAKNAVGANPTDDTKVVWDFRGKQS